MHVWKSSVISLTSYFQDIFQTAKPIPDYLQTFQTFPDLNLIPVIFGRRGNPESDLRMKNVFHIGKT